MDNNKKNFVAMDDIKQLMREHYLTYASYVILDRAIPDIFDGLKPVQRRILQMLWQMHDGKLHKVANVAGQTMALHPHGDAPIVEALVNMANKGYLLDTQGNFGNLLTGDPHAAARYIETRLSPLAHETMFNPALTSTVPSYDGRHQEPSRLPAKIPVVLIHGAEGIAVGMSTTILPHNFIEVLQAQIALLEGRPFELHPDFPTGGLMDSSEYAGGKGKVRLRAKIEIKDPKTISIKEICYGTTTESLIRSIDEAAKRGKIKIDAIHDYTSDKVEVEIKLPRGQQASEMIDALYAFTECQVSLHSQVLLIKDDHPWEGDVHEILRYNTLQLQELLRRELELEKKHLLDKIFERSLEQIFIEERLYKLIEEIAEYNEIHEVIAKALEPFHGSLERVPLQEDREKLLSIPIRRISRFDIAKNQKDVAELKKKLGRVEKELKNICQVAIHYIQKLIEKYGEHYPRRTKLEAIATVDKKALEIRNVRVGFDPAQGFLGTKVSGGQIIECTNVDKILLFYREGSYKVVNIPEKQYVAEAGAIPMFAAVADKKTVFSVVYREKESMIAYAKRFIVEKFILEKLYRFFEENAGLELLYFSAEPSIRLRVRFVPLPRQKTSAAEFCFDDVLVKGVGAKGVRMASRPVAELFNLE
jgi:topoisomerase-4 subunit A